MAPQIDPWVLTCVDPAVKTPALLWNGQIGVRIGRDGTGIEDGFFALDNYETSGEEKILALPNPLAGEWTAGEHTQKLSPELGVGYQQSLDMRTGVLMTGWNQVVDGRKVAIGCWCVIDPKNSVLAQRWQISSDEPVHVHFAQHNLTNRSTGVFDSERQSGTFQLGSSLRLLNLWVSASRDNRAKQNDVSLVPSIFTIRGLEIDNKVDHDHTLNFERVVELKPAGAPMRRSQLVAEFPTFDTVSTASVTASFDQWKSDIEIDGPVEDQQAVRSFLFYLRSAITSTGERKAAGSGQQPAASDLAGGTPALHAMSISPFGLSDATYNGHVFWDADMWVFPALALVDPHVARTIPEYRLSQFKAARQNFFDWINAGRPVVAGQMGGVEDFGAGGAGTPKSEGLGVKYPWESGVTGKETVPGPSRFEHHITGDVAFSVAQAASLGLAPSGASEMVTYEASGFYSLRSELNNSMHREIKGVMSVDENHVGDNDLYTNLLAQWCADGGRWLDDNVRNDKRTYKLPHDDKSFLTYDGDSIRSYKQAAAVLAIYPLQYPPAEKQARVMMDRFAGKVIKNGPAMSDAIHSIIWSRLDDRQKAYDAWRASWQPFTSHPLMLFSEKRSKDTCYFTTGAAGSLQSVLYGFLGFRIDSRKQDGAAWSLPLRGGSWLSVKPHLPPTWRSVKFKNFTVLGRRYTLTATQHDVHVTQGDK